MNSNIFLWILLSLTKFEEHYLQIYLAYMCETHAVDFVSKIYKYSKLQENP